jgi:uncharacterized membrane protein
MFGLQLIGLAAGSVVGLYQLGVLKRLPDPPLRRVDSTRVDASEYGYKWLHMPDAPLMVFQYAISTMLVSAGGRERARDLPLLPLLTTAKFLGDVLTNLYLAKEEWTYNKAFCAYCQTATLASLASLVLSVPESRVALRELRA